jgi:diguanylate cyclase (GGDEF)-like protein
MSAWAAASLPEPRAKQLLKVYIYSIISDVNQHEMFIGPLPKQSYDEIRDNFHLFPQDRTAEVMARALYGQKMARMESDDLREKLANSQIDELTGVYRKDAIYQRLDDLLVGFEMGRRGSDRHNSALVIVFGAEKFKEINDRQGYAAGSQALGAVGKLLINTARSSKGDLPGRIGGDEFVLVVPFDKEEIAEEKLLQVFEDRIRDCVPEKYPGLPSLRWNHAFYRPGDTAETLIEVKADVKGQNISLYRSHSQSDEEYQQRLELALKPALPNISPLLK